MLPSNEFKHFPQLDSLTDEQKRERLNQAKAMAFGPDRKLTRWRGNLLYFAIMFAVSVIFMMYIAPAMGLSQDASAMVMLVVVLPLFFILQQRRYIRLIRQALYEIENESRAR